MHGLCDGCKEESWIRAKEWSKDYYEKNRERYIQNFFLKRKESIMNKVRFLVEKYHISDRYVDVTRRMVDENDPFIKAHKKFGLTLMASIFLYRSIRSQNHADSCPLLYKDLTQCSRKKFHAFLRELGKVKSESKIPRRYLERFSVTGDERAFLDSIFSDLRGSFPTRKSQTIMALSIVSLYIVKRKMELKMYAIESIGLVMKADSWSLYKMTTNEKFMEVLKRHGG